MFISRTLWSYIKENLHMLNRLVVTSILMGLIAGTVEAEYSGIPSEGYNRYDRHKGGHHKLPRPARARDFIDHAKPAPEKVELGKVLFYDKVLSGNLNISCATCHHAHAGMGDGLSLSSGEGAKGLGVTRDTGTGDEAIHERVPRNAPHIFNIAAKEYVRMFHDGRVEVSKTAPSGFNSPAGDELPLGLENILSAQAMFPVTSATEMAGQLSENVQAEFAAAGDLPGVWNHIADKVKAIPEYVDLFSAAFSDVNAADDITYVHIANAIAAYENVAGTTIQSPFDQYLRGDSGALSRNQKRGMRLFYGKARCSSCHRGTYQTDHGFHAIAVPQVGPGKGDGEFGYEDFGRERVTNKPQDRYKFRTPTLRNLAVTAPYGHSGAFDTIESIVKHHTNPIESLYTYDRNQVTLPSNEELDSIDFKAMDDLAVLTSLADANELNHVHLSKKQMEYLLDFLSALNDPAIYDMRKLAPTSVPSGLPVFD